MKMSCRKNKSFIVSTQQLPANYRNSAARDKVVPLLVKNYAMNTYGRLEA
jgi:hypothetical protein